VKSVVLLPLPLLLLCLAAVSCQRRDAVPRGAAPPIVKTAAGDEMVLLPAGKFRMGRDDGQPDAAPAHEVSLDSFLIDRYEVTQEQYTKVAHLNGSHFKDPQRPVEMISWANAAMYCNQRSKAEGLEPCYDENTAACNFAANGYRLPTEAEWEYACRAGSSTPYPFGDDPRQLPQHAWYAENSGKTTHLVGKCEPNAWGLFDMLGNVAEWCNDVYSEDYYKHSPAENPRGPADGEKYVLRGGAWSATAEVCRPDFRVGQEPGFQDACFHGDAIGFRCVRAANETRAPAVR
jgi:formylglycine-generating enzyme required for sulfatase activity